MAVKWLDDPEDHDYDAAADYLSMLAEDVTVAATVNALKSTKPVYRKAKDILRAARLTDENTPIPCRLVSWAHQA